MAKIIRKIEPDFIKESILEVRYNSSFPENLIPGLLYNQLSDQFKFSSFNEELKLPNEIQELKNFNFKINGEGYFYDDLITIKLKQNSLVFNCIGNYPLWEEYFKRIQNVLHNIHSTKIINFYTRIGLRYINEYPELDLSELVNFTYGFNMPQVKSDSLSFRSDFIYKDHRVILNLVNSAQIKKTVEPNIPPVDIKASYVDVDVINESLKTSNVDELIQSIELVHSIEKDVFFNKILSSEFLKKLKLT